MLPKRCIIHVKDHFYIKHSLKHLNESIVDFLNQILPRISFEILELSSAEVLPKY